MVPTSNITALIVVGILCFAIPIGTLLIMRKLSKKIIGAFFAGVLSFYLLQVVIRIPLMQFVLPKMDWYVQLPEKNLLLYALFLGFTAALFETVGRYFTIKYVLRDRQGYYSGISHGIGHGGIEMMLLVGVAYITYVFYSMQINAGAFQSLINAAATENALAGEQMVMLQGVLVDTPTRDFYIALIERILAFTFHIGMSLLIMEGIVRGKEFRYFAIVIFLHTALDALAVVMSVNGVNVWLIEAMVAVFAVGSLIYIIKAKKRFGDKIHPVEDDTEALESDY